MYRFPIFVLFIGYDEFEREFPDAKPEICYSSVIVYGLDARKPVFGGLRTTQAQTSLRIHAVCLISAFVIPYLESIIYNLATGEI